MKALNENSRMPGRSMVPEAIGESDNISRISSYLSMRIADTMRNDRMGFLVWLATGGFVLLTSMMGKADMSDVPVDNGPRSTLVPDARTSDMPQLEKVDREVDAKLTGMDYDRINKEFDAMLQRLDEQKVDDDWDAIAKRANYDRINKEFSAMLKRLDEQKVIRINKEFAKMLQRMDAEKVDAGWEKLIAQVNNDRIGKEFAAMLQRLEMEMIDDSWDDKKVSDVEIDEIDNEWYKIAENMEIDSIDRGWDEV